MTEREARERAVIRRLWQRYNERLDRAHAYIEKRKLRNKMAG
ncbi:MAG: hypothetical protein H6Q67_2247 [Firmicutes bacterium]|nr:hypothetical protein [Bacillota bacterium]